MKEAPELPSPPFKMPKRLKEEAGFTLIEVLVASIVLVVGILGVLKMIDIANADAGVTQTRSQANGLVRQILESVRGVNYGQLSNQSAVETLLKNQPGL